VGYSNGHLGDKLFDAHGKLKDLRGIIDTLGTALSKLKTPQEFNAFIGDMGGARSGKAFELLLKNLSMTDEQISQLLPKIKAVGTAEDDAQKRTNTWHSITKELGTTFESLAGALGTPLLGPLKTLATTINAFLDDLMKNHTALLMVMASFLVTGTVIAGVTFAVTSLIFVFSALGSILLPVLASVAGISVLALVGSQIAAHWSTILPVLQPVLKLFQQASSVLGLVFKDISAIWQKTTPQFGTALHQLQPPGEI